MGSGGAVQGGGALINAGAGAAMAQVRKAALDDLLPFQRDDFEGIFKAMDGFPVTVRLLDPPLHEFLPEVREPSPRASVA